MLLNSYPIKLDLRFDNVVRDETKKKKNFFEEKKCFKKNWTLRLVSTMSSP